MTKHVPVLLEEVLENLLPEGKHFKNQAKFIDATLGAGGYTKAIAKEGGGRVLGIDTDTTMLQIAEENLRGTDAKVVNGNFRDIKRIAEENNFMDVDGIVYDLGVSNVHFSDEIRGFSFKNSEAELDMRLDTKSQSIRASDLLNALRTEQLRQIFEDVMGVNEAFALAKRIVAKRDEKKFKTVGDLLELIPSSSFSGKVRVNPATKAFLALRIAVNSELDNLRESLPQALEVVKAGSPRGEAGGRIVVVSFHSLEDGIVKDQFNEWEREKQGRVVTEKPIVPTERELLENPKSRSAKLRVFEKN